jgi:integrase
MLILRPMADADFLPLTECYRLMSGVMRSAVRDRLVGVDPCERVRLPRRRRKDTDDQTITRDELMATLLPAAPHRYGALNAPAAGTGLRRGECVGLRWDAVDLAGGVARAVRVAEEYRVTSDSSRIRGQEPGGGPYRSRHSSLRCSPSMPTPTGPSRMI